jgi:hypothetical protein
MSKKWLFFINIIFLLLLHPALVSSADKRDGSDIRLQNNGWIRIEDVRLENIPPEVFYKDSPQMLMMHKDMVKAGSSRKDIGKLHVKFRFLKPCKATTRIDRMTVEPLSVKEEEIADQMILAFKYHKEGQQAKKEQIFRELNNKYSDAALVFSDMAQEKYKCGYQTTVYATYLSSKGSEIQTVSDVAVAEMTSSGIRKSEMIPGDTAVVTFLLFNDDIKSWKVWVPK